MALRTASKTEPQSAFRAGVLGVAYAEARQIGLEEEPVGFALGPNEEIVLQIRRLPGLDEPRAAWETGRVLLAIARLFDKAGAPAIVGRQFTDNITAAAMTHQLRGTARPWGCEDTVAMFIEMYERIFPAQPKAFSKIRDSLLAFAKSELADMPGDRPRPRSHPFKRRLYETA